MLSDEGDTPPAHRRAAAFSISKMLFPEGTKSYATVSRIVLPTLHYPFLEVVTLEPSTAPSPSILVLTPRQAVQTLQTLLTNTDPSPDLISSLLTPVLPGLYSLLWAMDSVKTSDPTLKTILRGFLRTWGRLVDSAEGFASLWLIISGEGGDWRVDISGEIERVQM
jgi:hypothetical protein